MSDQAATFPDEPITRLMSGLHGTRLGLVSGLAALGLAFHAEVAAAVNTWIASTAYNHCFLVIPIVLFLIWDRRATLNGLVAEPMPLAGLLVLPFAIVWLAAERLGIMEGRQLATISIVEVLFLAMLGRRLWTAISGPLLYLYFLVPFGEFLTPRLQDITTWFTRRGLDVLGIPAYIDGYIIEIPEGVFFVAEACAGLRFLIASIAFGVLYALLMYRNTARRLIFILLSIAIPIVANGFRALGIVWLGHVLGSAEAAATDHVLYGWIFFSIVIVLLTLVGLPFRQDVEALPSAISPMARDKRGPLRGWIACLTVIALAFIGPAVVLGAGTASAANDMALQPLDFSPACTTVEIRKTPVASVGRAMEQRMTCGGTTLNVTVEIFPSRSTASVVNAERRRLTRLIDAEDLTEGPMTTQGGDPLLPWRVIRANQPAFVGAVGLWVDGHPITPGMTMRINMARDSLGGPSHAPALVSVIPVTDWTKVDPRRRADLERQIADLLRSHPEIDDQVRAMVRTVRQ